MFLHAFCLIIAIKVPHLSLPNEKRISGRLKKWLYITKNIPGLMIEIKILGSGCARCESLEKMTRKAVEEMKLEANVEKVGDIQEILKYSVMRTPALVINEKVMFSGELPGMTELKSLLFSQSMKP
jgi:small redox-active disulfide protein 2